MMQPFYTPQEIAERWRVSPRTVQRIFQDREGVLIVTDRAYSGAKRRKIRISEAALLRYEQDRSRGFMAEREARRG